MQNMVRFPLTGMDMAPHVVKRSQSSWSLPSHWSPWRRPYGLGRNPDDFLYDLYAVCNHHGSMHGGHYTGEGLQTAWKSDKCFMNVLIFCAIFGVTEERVFSAIKATPSSAVQPTVRTPSTASGTASTTARCRPWPTRTCASRRPTSSSTSGGLPSPPGRPTAPWQVGVPKSGGGGGDASLPD